MKLRMQKDLQVEGGFRDETRRYLESLGNITGNVVELSQLIENNSRVTFVRGIAGMGKTVLAKQMMLFWSHDKMYNEVEVCIAFECREINCFQGTRGTHLPKYEILEEFVKTKFKFDLHDGEQVLFIVDGLDELFDIGTTDSVIFQLLNRSIYPASKVVVTGRPHVERKLEECGEIGGLAKVEILGLNDKDIEEYVNKFPSPEGLLVDLNTAKTSSNDFLPILHIPQFLNTFCCVASFLKGAAIHNGTELYCWAVYLLLKQHGDKRDPSTTNVISEVFREYSKELLALGEVCHRLVIENKLIIPKKDIESLLLDCGNGNEFIGSLFFDVSDSFEENLLFKHLTLIEFFAALDICKNYNLMDVIIDNLKNGFLEVVIFACQLISGCNSRGIIQEMVKVSAAHLQEINGNVFCFDVVKALSACDLDERTKFLSAVDIITSCLNEDFTDKTILLSTVQMLNTKNFKTKDVKSKKFAGIDLLEPSSKLYTIYKHLVNICKCNDNELQIAFEHIHVRRCHVNDLEMIKCAMCFGFVVGISLNKMQLSINAARHELEMIGFGTCTVVNMYKCKLEDDYIESQSCRLRLEGIGIQQCNLKNISSLINAFHWVTSSSPSPEKRFGLYDLKFKDGWWSKLVVAIEKENMANGKVNLEYLMIRKCTPPINKDLQRRVRRFTN